jgi:hypothetical protein
VAVKQTSSPLPPTSSIDVYLSKLLTAVSSVARANVTKHIQKPDPAFPTSDIFFFLGFYLQLFAT